MENVFKNIDEQRQWNNESMWSDGGHEWSKSFGTTENLWNNYIFDDIKDALKKGDRVGVCVTQLDSKALERGIACTQGHVTLISAALVSVRQIRFFKAAPALLACMCSPRRPISLSPFPTGASSSSHSARSPMRPTAATAAGDTGYSS